MENNKPSYDSDSDLESQKSVNLSEKHKGSVADAEPCGPLHLFADARPFGLFSCALTTSVLSLINIQAGSVTVPNVIIGLGT